MLLPDLLGSALFAAITEGSVDIWDSITAGLTNAATGAIYGNSPIKNLGSAFARGAGAGAATAAINNLSRTGADLRNGQNSRAKTAAQGAQGNWIGNSVTAGIRDPKGGCGGTSPFEGNLSNGPALGYRASTLIFNKPRRGGSGLGDFVKEVAKGALLGGVTSALFHGAGKAVEKLKNSVRSACVGNEGGSYSPNGVGDSVITNKGNTIDTKPYNTHSTVNKNPGYKGEPNTSVDILDRTGSMETRRWFGDNAKAFRDVDMTNHGNPKLHPEWPHEHFWQYGPDGKPKGR